MAKRHRSYFASNWTGIIPLLDPAKPKIPLTLCVFSGMRDVPELVLALHSFTASVGQATRIIVGSDGSITPELIEQLSKYFGQVELFDVMARPLETELQAAVEKNVLLRKLVFVREISTKNFPALYIDSDIFFYPSARSQILHLIQQVTVPAYMMDLTPCLDFRMLERTDLDIRSVNSGILWFPTAFDWAFADSRLATSLENPDHFTEQTTIHLAMQANHAMPFDPRRFILDVTDGRKWLEKYRFDTTAVCRHFVTPVRHRMWMRPLPL